MGDYLPPAPPYNSGSHRIVWAVFGHDEKVNEQEAQDYFESRESKDLETWVLREEADIQLVASNFYYSDWDESVDQTHQRMGYTPPMGYRSPRQEAKLTTTHQFGND